MSEDNQFVALGSNNGPTDAGFKTFSTTIVQGGQFAGTQSGILATANLGSVPGAGTVGVAITAVGNVNDNGAVSVSNDAPRGWGASISGPALGIFATGTNGVHGKTGSQNDSGVWGENTGGGFGVSGSSFGIGVFGGRPGSLGLEGKPAVNVGVWGTTVAAGLLADSGDGVLGEGQNGVHGRSRSPNDSGVWGENIKGGFGVSGSTNGGSGARGTIAGVWGSNSGDGAGVRGTSAVTGVLGEGSIGVHGISSVTGGFAPGIGVQAEQTGGGIGLLASSKGSGGVAVAANAAQGIGVEATGGVAPLRLVPSATAGKPSIGPHSVGEFYVDNAGVLYFCVRGGTPGTWKTLQLV